MKEPPAGGWLALRIRGGKSLASNGRAALVHYFTVFDRNYAARGLLMLDSLRRVSPQAQTTVLALDDDAFRAATGHCDDVLRVQDLGDSQFEAAQANRSHEEFCWTCAPILSDFMLRRSEPGSIVVYVDADLLFYTDPAVLITEMENDKNIMIHPHRFSADKTGYESASGTFNVGFVAFRASEEAQRCTARWRQQVLDLCVKDPERGLCGDQGYLNEWPSLYPGLHIMENIGGGVAPWNVASCDLSRSMGVLTVDNRPVVFFHFHELRTVKSNLLFLAGTVPALGYNYDHSIWRLIYDDYIRRLRDQSLELEGKSIGQIEPDLTYSLPKFLYHVATGEILSSGNLAVFF
jgi:hypothetical protein